MFHPLMRVWIEINFKIFEFCTWHVSPSYEGVDWNHIERYKIGQQESFTLLWGCGLKCELYRIHNKGLVFHPLMRVWIEIYQAMKILFLIMFHPLMRVWIEIYRYIVYVNPSKFHPLMRVWIEIEFRKVLWTFKCEFHPLMRVWIEMRYKKTPKSSELFHPLMRVWIEINLAESWKNCAAFHPLMRVWIEMRTLSHT